MAWGYIGVFDSPVIQSRRLSDGVRYNVLEINDVPNHLLTCMISQRKSTGKESYLSSGLMEEKQLYHDMTEVLPQIVIPELSNAAYSCLYFGTRLGRFQLPWNSMCLEAILVHPTTFMM